MARRSASQFHAPPQADAVVYIVDDDATVRETLSSLVRSTGFGVALFASGREFLQSALKDVPSCLILDVRLPGFGGLDLQAELERSNNPIPIIFITGFGDIPMSVQAMKGGAVDFLTKPFRDQDLLDAISSALDLDQRRRQQEAHLADVRLRFDSLTERERQVMILATDGLMNKQIAAEMDLSEVTVKFHRGNLVKKMGGRSLPDLVRMAEALGLRRTKQ